MRTFALAVMTCYATVWGHLRHMTLSRKLPCSMLHGLTDEVQLRCVGRFTRSATGMNRFLHLRQEMVF